MKKLLKIHLTCVLVLQILIATAANEIVVDASGLESDSPIMIVESGVLNKVLENGIVKFEVEYLPTLIRLVSINKSRVTTHRLIWLTEKNLRIEGSLEEDKLSLFPTNEGQPEADEVLKGLPDIEENRELAISKPNLVYIATTLQWQKSHYLEKLIRNIRPADKDFWATTKIKTYLIDLKNIGYDKTTQQFDHMTAVNTNGKSQKFEHQRQKFLLIDFSSSGCKPCLADIDELVELYEEHQDNLEILTVWNDPKQEPWLKIAKKQKDKIIWTSLRDESGVIFNTFEIDVFPTYILVSPEGMVMRRWKGSRIKKIKKYL